MILLPILIGLGPVSVDANNPSVLECSHALAESWQSAQRRLPKSEKFDGGFELLMTTTVTLKTRMPECSL